MVMLVAVRCPRAAGHVAADLRGSHRLVRLPSSIHFNSNDSFDR